MRLPHPSLLIAPRERGLLAITFGLACLLMVLAWSVRATLTPAPTSALIEIVGPAADRTAGKAIAALTRDGIPAHRLSPVEMARRAGLDAADLEAAELTLPVLIDAPAADPAMARHALHGLPGVTVRSTAASPSQTGLRQRLGLLALTAALAGCLAAGWNAYTRTRTQAPALAVLEELGATRRQRATAIGLPVAIEAAVGTLAALLLAAVLTTGPGFGLPLALLAAALATAAAALWLSLGRAR